MPKGDQSLRLRLERGVLLFIARSLYPHPKTGSSGCDVSFAERGYKGCQTSERSNSNCSITLRLIYKKGAGG